jgi:hypothetical protein
LPDSVVIVGLRHHVFVRPGPNGTTRGTHRHRQRTQTQRCSSGSTRLFLLVVQECLVNGIHPLVSLTLFRAAQDPCQLHRRDLRVDGFLHVPYLEPIRMAAVVLVLVWLGNVNVVFGKEHRGIQRDDRGRCRRMVIPENLKEGNVYVVSIGSCFLKINKYCNGEKEHQFQ